MATRPRQRYATAWLGWWDDPDLDAAVDILDRAAAAGLVEPGLIDAAAERTRMVRQRAGFLETVVTALAGGTGQEVEPAQRAGRRRSGATGPLRPTTDQPLALLPANPEPGLVRLLDDLGIEERVEQEGMPLVAVLDLPDIDSVAPDHVCPCGDWSPGWTPWSGCWTPRSTPTPPSTRPGWPRLASYSATFLFVLNQVDRLPTGSGRRSSPISASVSSPTASRNRSSWPRSRPARRTARGNR